MNTCLRTRFGHYTLWDEPFAICNVRFWECAGMEDDPTRYDSNVPDGDNEVSPMQARRNYQVFGAMSQCLPPLSLYYC